MPKSWVKENNLKKGDLITIDERDNELILTAGQASQKTEPSKNSISAAHKDLQMLKIEIVSSYLNNYDVIEIRDIGNHTLVPKIKNIIRELIGLEIIQQDREKIIAKDLLNIREVSVETLIRRMDNIIRSMLTDSISCFENDCFEELYERDIEVNRLFYLSSRTIRAAMKSHPVAKELGISNVDLLFSWSIVTRLEKIADLTKRIARELRTVHLSSAQKTLVKEIYGELKEEYNAVMKSYYKHDIEIAFKIEMSSRDLMARCNAALKEDTSVEMRSVIEFMKRMMSSIREVTRGVIGMESKEAAMM